MARKKSTDPAYLLWQAKVWGSLSLGLFIYSFLSLVATEYRGIWIMAPFVTVFAAWNWPEKETRGNTKSVR